MVGSRPFVVGAAAILIAVILIYWLLVRSPYSTAEAALQAFYGGDPRPECMQAEPLRRHGSTVVPLVIRDLPNRAMPRRRYAIGFLGEGRYGEALPVLEGILLDTTEIYYFRSDALAAIFEIAPIRAQKLASRVVSPSEDKYGLLARTTRAVARGDLKTDYECSW